MAIEFQNDVTAGTVLVRSAIQSQNYVAGASGWSIFQDGSAEFSDVTIRGSLITGPAGTNHVEILDGQAQVDFVNTSGNRAIIKAQSIGTTAGWDASSSDYTLTGAPGGNVTGSTKIELREEIVNLGFFRASDDSGYGGNVFMTPTLVQAGCRDVGGGDTGGQLYLDALGFTISADPGLNDMIFGDTSGIRAAGRFVSSATGTFTASAGWSVTESRVERWGPFVTCHLFLTRTGAAIAAGNIADVVIATLDADRPQSQTSMATQWFAGTAAVSLDSAGDCVLRWLSTILNTGDALRMDMCYYRPGPT